ncbi:hypothetical protein J2Z77_000494 [Streptomyces avidinii]|uniref:Uncharacterized protein n=1 Tax=Streptomyces avidinii TaxID=1895 RepID=A0ABS4KXE1_STRAV|nr:hypothetical protein [Streptomyces avidinii]
MDMDAQHPGHPPFEGTPDVLAQPVDTRMRALRRGTGAHPHGHCRHRQHPPTGDLGPRSRSRQRGPADGPAPTTRRRPGGSASWRGASFESCGIPVWSRWLRGSGRPVRWSGCGRAGARVPRCR